MRYFAGKNVAIFTLEMSKEQLMGHVLASVSKVDSSNLEKVIYLMKNKID